MAKKRLFRRKRTGKKKTDHKKIIKLGRQIGQLMKSEDQERIALLSGNVVSAWNISTLVPISANYIISRMTGISQGTGINQRVGDRISVKQVEVRYSLQPAIASCISSGDYTAGTNVREFFIPRVRAMVVMFKKMAGNPSTSLGGVMPTWEDLLDVVSTAGPQNYHMMGFVNNIINKNIKVLYDRIHFVYPYNYTQRGQAGALPPSVGTTEATTQSYHFFKRFKVPKLTTYNNSTNDETSMNENHIFFLLWSDNYRISNNFDDNQPFFTAQTRTVFNP